LKSNTQKLYSLETGKIINDGNSYSTFKISAHYKDILRGLNDEYISTLIRSREDVGLYAGLIMGSLQEHTVKGNWE